MIDYAAIGANAALFAVAFWRIWANRKIADAKHAANAEGILSAHRRLDMARERINKLAIKPVPTLKPKRKRK